MKRIVSLVGVVIVLLTGVALAQRPPPQPKPEAGQSQVHGGMCPMMSGGGMRGGGGMMGTSSWRTGVRPFLRRLVDLTGSAEARFQRTLHPS